MKRMSLLAVLAVGWFPVQASAMCYTVLNPNGVVLWRGQNPPIDLSKPVSEGLRQVFPAGTSLVISDQTEGCSPVGPGAFFGPTPGMRVSRPAP